jgi:hypothetical protein
LARAASTETTVGCVLPFDPPEPVPPGAGVVEVGVVEVGVVEVGVVVDGVVLVVVGVVGVVVVGVVVVVVVVVVGPPSDEPPLGGLVAPRTAGCTTGSSASTPAPAGRYGFSTV